jgi:hypothetical protein
MQNTQFDAKTLASRMNQVVRLSVAATSEDELETVVPTGPAGVSIEDARTSLLLVLDSSERLRQWLLDLRLLRHVPLAYLVPDPLLLPLESIRFFHLDTTWADRLVDGALSAGDLGTLDMTFTWATMQLMRKALDDSLGLGSDRAITGLLIRSELVARWPDLIVRGLMALSDGTEPGDLKKAMPILRKDLLSRSIMIVLFGGVPAEVQIREPHIGLRFGIEPNEGHPGQYHVPRRYQNGSVNKEKPDPDVTVCGTTGKLKLDGLYAEKPVDYMPKNRPPEDVPDVTGGQSRDIAITLIRPPYVQRFHGSDNSGWTFERHHLDPTALRAALS